MSTAEGVNAAFQTAMEWQPDVMLLDVTLPDGDGLSVLTMLRKSNRLPPRTIALTGHDDEEVRQRCIGAGCIDVLLKPVPIARLVGLVRSL